MRLQKSTHLEFSLVGTKIDRLSSFHGYTNHSRNPLSNLVPMAQQSPKGHFRLLCHTIHPCVGCLSCCYDEMTVKSNFMKWRFILAPSPRGHNPSWRGRSHHIHSQEAESNKCLCCLLPPFDSGWDHSP